MMHTFNAHAVGDTVILDAPFYDSNLFPFIPNKDGSPPSRAPARGLVRRLTFDLASSSSGWTESIEFPTVIGDLGCIDPRYVTKPQRYCYAGYEDRSRISPALLKNLPPGRSRTATRGSIGRRTRCAAGSPVPIAVWTSAVSFPRRPTRPKGRGGCSASPTIMPSGDRSSSSSTRCGWKRARSPAWCCRSVPGRRCMAPGCPRNRAVLA